MKTVKYKYGYISYLDITYPYIYKFVVYEKYRGKGKARELANKFPKKCWLYALPIKELISKRGLELKQLIRFYRSIGFKLKKNSKMNEMYRK